MATITNLTGTFKTTAGHSTITASGSLTVSVDDWLVVFVALPNAGVGGAALTVTVEDSDGLNTYTQRASINRDPSGAGDGVTLKVYTCQVTDAVTSGNITATFSDTVGSSCIQVYRVRPATNEVISHVTTDATGDTGSSTTPSTGTTASITNGNIIFAAAGIEGNNTCTGDSDTTNGSWSTIVQRTADNSGDTDSTALASQYKTVTATGTQSWTITDTDSNDWAVTYVVLKPAKTLTVGLGSYAVTGASGANAVSLERGRLLDATVGESYAITGTDVSLSYTGAKIINAEPGSYAVTGTDVSTLQAWKPSIEAGSYAVTGTEVGTLHQWEVTPDAAGSYEHTGTDVSLEAGFEVAADAGSYTHSGTDAGFNKSGAYSIVVNAGSYEHTGTDVSVIHGYKFTVDAGSYAVTGSDTPVLHGWKLFLDTDVGSSAVTGSSVELTKTASAPARVGGTLRASSTAASLAVREAGSLTVDGTPSLKVSTTTPRLSVPSRSHTLKVR